MNFLTSLRTLLLALVLSIGISYAYAAWAPPTTTPPGGNIDAPVNVGTASQTKTGFLWSNGLGSTLGGYFSGAVGIGITPPAGLLLGVAGNVGADKYCDRNGGNCIDAVTLGGSGSSYWAASGNDIQNTNSGNVNVNSGGCYYKFQNGALHTNCDVTHDVTPPSISFSGSLSGFAGASNHCLETDGSHIYYDAWCGNRVSGPITISGCTISGSPFYFGNTSDPSGTLTANGNQIVFSNGGTWTSSCPLTGSLNIVGGGGGVSISGNGASITASGHGSSGTISVAPSGNQNAVWGTKATQVYVCPNISNCYDPNSGNSVQSTCNGQVTTINSSCTATDNSWGNCNPVTSYICPSGGYLVK